MTCTEQTPEPLKTFTQPSTAAWDGPRAGELPRIRLKFAERRREVHVAARADLNHNVEVKARDGHSGDHGLDPGHTQVVQLKLQSTWTRQEGAITCLGSPGPTLSKPRSIHRSIDQSVDPLIDPSIRRSVHRSTHRSIGRSSDRSVGPSIHRSIRRPVRRSTHRLIHRPTYRSTCRSINRSVRRAFKSQKSQI